MSAVIPSSFQFRQCLEQGSCIKFLPHVPGLGCIVRNHKIKGQAMGYQPWLDCWMFCCSWKTWHEEWSLLCKDTSIDSGCNKWFCEWDCEGHHTSESIWWPEQLWAWFWVPQWCQSGIAPSEQIALVTVLTRIWHKRSGSCPIHQKR